MYTLTADLSVVFLYSVIVTHLEESATFVIGILTIINYCNTDFNFIGKYTICRFFTQRSEWGGKFAD